MHIQTNIMFTMIEHVVAEQYQPLKSKLSRIFAKYRIHATCRMNFERQLTELFNDLFVKSIPSTLSERIIRERYIIQSIQYQLRQQNFVLRRTADNQNTFYLGAFDEFEQACTKYMNNCSSYMLIGSINSKKTEQDHLFEISQSIDAQLRTHRETGLLLQKYFTQLISQPDTKLKLPRLYFLPENNTDNGIIVQPRFTSYYHSPIQKIALYIDRKIRFLFDYVCQSTSVQNGDDFRQRFSNFINHDKLSNSTTLLATFKINGFYENMPHHLLLESLNALLLNPLVLGRYQRTTPGLLVELASIVLRSNYFIYGNHVYRFAHGSPLNLPLTRLLGNIYLHFRQAPLWHEVRLKNLFYARFNNEGILTWNDSEEALQQVFEQFQQALPNPIELTTRIDKHGVFLDCHIENCNGRFHTRVYRDSTKPSFVLPYFPGHPRIIYRQWYRFRMMRAAFYCHDLEDFKEERRYIEATFLANGFSLDMIEYLWRQFLQRCGFRLTQIKCMNDYDFGHLSTAVSRILSQERTRHSVQGEEYKLLSEHKLIPVTFYYDWGTRAEFNRKFQQLWSNIINNDPTFKKNGFQIQLISRHCYPSNAILAHPKTNTPLIHMH